MIIDRTNHFDGLCDLAKEGELMSFDSILFDLDGTLWDSVDEIVATWNNVIECHPGLRVPITRAEQESVMGLQMDEISRKLFPTEPPDRQMALMEECIREENQYLEEHGGTLYPEVAATLEYLHQKYKLFIVSNCQCGYIEAFLKAHKLADHFDGFLCYGETKKSKGENIKQVIAQFELKHPVYVGDTVGDQKSAQFAEIPFIYAAYGFGHADNFDRQISSFCELRSV